MEGERLLTIAFIVFVVWLVVGTAAVIWHLARQSREWPPGEGRAAFWSFISALGSGGLFRFLGVDRMPRPPRDPHEATDPRPAAQPRREDKEG